MQTVTKQNQVARSSDQMWQLRACSFVLDIVSCCGRLSLGLESRSSCEFAMYAPHCIVKLEHDA